MDSGEKEIAQTLDFDPYLGISREAEFVATESPTSVPSPIDTHEHLRSQSFDSFEDVPEEFIRVETPPSPTSVETEYLENSSPDEYWSIHSDTNAELEHYALKGNWKAAKGLLDADESLATRTVAPYAMTALHVAALKGHSDFVKKIVQKMPGDTLGERDGRNLTALDYIALNNGDLLEAAKALIDVNGDLANLLRGDGWGALHFAVFSGSHSRRSTDFIRYLAEKTTNERVMSNDLVENLVVKGYLDVLLDLLNRFPSYLENTSNAAALFNFLSSAPSNFSSSSRFGPLQRCVYSFIPVESSYEPSHYTTSSADGEGGCHILKVLLRAYYQALHWLRLLLYNIFRRAIPSSCISRHQDAKRRHNCAVILVDRVWNLILDRGAIKESFYRQPQIIHRYASNVVHS